MGEGGLGRLRGSIAAGLSKRRKGGRREPDARDGRRSDSASGTDGIEVSYAPERDGDADPGEVVWAWVPYEDDPTQGKDRPVLILGHDGPLLAGVPLSSKNHEDRRDEHDWVDVGTGAWDERRRPSYADASRLLRFRADEVRREGAALDRGRFDEVLVRVARIHDWTDG